MATDMPHQIHLAESEMPTQWYNLIADLPTAPPPPLHPGTHQPAGPDDFAPLFPMALIEQEMTPQRYIDIPGGVPAGALASGATKATSNVPRSSTAFAAP